VKIVRNLTPPAATLMTGQSDMKMNGLIKVHCQVAFLTILPIRHLILFNWLPSEAEAFALLFAVVTQI